MSERRWYKHQFLGHLRSIQTPVPDHNLSARVPFDVEVINRCAKHDPSKFEHNRPKPQSHESIWKFLGARFESASEENREILLLAIVQTEF